MIYFFLLKDNNTPTTYSGKLFAHGLKAAGFPVSIVQNDDKKKHILKVIKSGTIIFQKCLHPLHQAARIKHLKGKVGLIHIDDDFSQMDKAGHIKTLETTDLILVVSPLHRKLLSSLVKTPCAVIRTITDLRQFAYFPQHLRTNNPPIIAWQQSHADMYAKDLLEIEKPLIELHQRFPYRLRLFGWHLGKDSTDRRDLISKHIPFAEFIPAVPIHDFFTNIVPQLQQANAFIVPYRDTPRSWAKGAFALRQVMALGVPVVVSKIGVHPKIIKDGDNGFLASTHEEWVAKLYKILTDPALAEHLSKNARQTVETEYSEKKCIEIFIKALHPYLK
ncbi:MAG: glycosyltransferase [Bacillota bacterium]|nr:glycosyltransferase [Bacillota bacterium]